MRAKDTAVISAMQLKPREIPTICKDITITNFWSKVPVNGDKILYIGENKTRMSASSKLWVELQKTSKNCNFLQFYQMWMRYSRPIESTVDNTTGLKLDGQFTLYTMF